MVVVWQEWKRHRYASVEQGRCRQRSRTRCRRVGCVGMFGGGIRNVIVTKPSLPLNEGGVGDRVGGTAVFGGVVTRYQRVGKAKRPSVSRSRACPAVDSAFGRRRVVGARDVETPTEVAPGECSPLG